MSKDITTTIRLYPSQIKFMADKKSHELLFVAGKGAGKSLALSLKAVQQACIPGARVIILRKELTKLRESSTIKLILNGEGILPPILPRGSYTHNKMNRTICINGGGEIYYTGIQDEFSLRSINASDIFIDEGTELTFNEYDEALQRLRVPCGNQQLCITTNPSNKRHWIYDRFIRHPSPGSNYIHATALENKSLPAKTLERYQQIDNNTNRYKQIVLGEWMDEEKMIYNTFDRNKNIVNKTVIDSYKDSIDRWLIGVDFGYKHPQGYILAALLNDGRIIITECKKVEGGLMLDRLNILGKWQHLNPTIIIDPSAPLMINECIARGWNAIKADNAVEIGIDRVRSRLFEQTLLIQDTCYELIDEIESYQYGDDGKPLKIYDDLVDPLRYVCNYVSEVYADNAIEQSKATNFYIY